MTDRDGRSNGSKTCQTRAFTPDSFLGQQPVSSCLTSGISDENKPPMIANTDSEEDYETSSEGPHSPRLAVHPSVTNITDSLESNESLLVNPALFPEADSSRKNDPGASYTIIGVAESPGTDVASKISSCEDQNASQNSWSEIQEPLSGLEELEAQRTEYFVAPRVKCDANKSESLPVITIATPWGSYEYPDVHMPAERLVSDSQVDIKEKMRLIAACMDGCSLATSRAKSKLFLCPADVGKDETKPPDGEFHQVECKVEDSWVYSRPVTPRTPKMITVTSPKVFSEASNVLPIIRNPDLGSDYTFPASPSGSSLPLSVNNTAVTMSSSFYGHRDGESPRNLTQKKSNYDPLSRIEGELAPLQNELSEIRGKVRALNLDYNLSCIDGMTKFPKMMNWINAENLSSHGQVVRPVRDDFIMSDYHALRNKNAAFKPAHIIGISNFGGNNEPRYRCPFANRSFLASGCSYDRKEVENEFKAAELIEEKIASHPDVSNAQVFSSGDCEPEFEGISAGSPRGTDRNLSPVYVCTSTPSTQSSKGEIGQVESEEETKLSRDQRATTSPEIRLPNFSDKISIVPIAYLGGMPDPPTEPVFSFAQEEEPGFGISHKVLRIEHPDAASRRRDESEKASSSFSETILTTDYETEGSISTRKEPHDFSISNNSPRESDRTSVSKFLKKSSRSRNNSSFTDGKETHGRTYIRGMISGPEDFL